MKNRINKTKELIKQAGQFLIDNFGKIEVSDIEHKNKKDLVTIIDKKTEKIIIDYINKNFPDDIIYAEESDNKNKQIFNENYTWVIDPLDGTTNYIQTLPIFSISIAILKEKEILAGFIYLPKLDELFYAVKGEGAFLNDKPIKVSETSELINSVAVTGFACLRANLKNNNLINFNNISPRLRGIRRFGSAAVDLCYVACGKFDFFWELYLQPWDVCAGALIVKEAGGIISDFKGNQNNEFIFNRTLIASNKNIYSKVLELKLKGGDEDEVI